MWYMHIPYSITLKRVNISRIYKEKEGYQAQSSPFSFVYTPFLSLLYDVSRPIGKLEVIPNDCG